MKRRDVDIDELLGKARSAAAASAPDVPADWQPSLMEGIRKEIRERAFLLFALAAAAVLGFFVASGSLAAAGYKLWQIIPPLPFGESSVNPLIEDR